MKSVCRGLWLWQPGLGEEWSTGKAVARRCCMITLNVSFGGGCHKTILTFSFRIEVMFTTGACSAGFVLLIPLCKMTLCSE